MGLSCNASPFGFVSGWWVALINGNYKTSDNAKGRALKNSEIFNEDETTALEYINETDYGKSVRAVILTKYIPNNTRVILKIFESDPTIFLKDDEIAKETKIEGIVKVKDKDTGYGKIIVPVYLKPEWYKQDPEKDKCHELYFKVECETPTEVNGRKIVRREFPISSDKVLKTWMQPYLHINAKSTVTGFYNGSKPRKAPNGWSEADKLYWFRLGRAYQGLGTVGKENIDWKYWYRGNDKKEEDSFEVKDVEWRGNQPGSDFEHPAAITEKRKVKWHVGSRSHFRFLLEDKDKDGNPDYEDSIYIHNYKASEGCIVLGDDDHFTKLWDLMGKLLNKANNDFENGHVTITLNVNDPVTKLDYSFSKALHLSGLDGSPNLNRALSDDEREDINPLSRSEYDVYVQKHSL